MSAWLDEWNRGQDVYISDRHRDRHFRAVTRDIIRLLPPGDIRVLDYGPGDALFADRIAAACGEVILCEAADSIRARLTARFTDHRGVSVIGPDGLTGLAAGSVDVMVVHSVVQYLDSDEIDALLRESHRLLGPDGLLVVGDIVPPGVGLVSDTVELLRFAIREGFLTDAVPALLRLAVSPYARRRRRHGLTRLDEQQMTVRARQAGLSGRRMRSNVGNNQARWTFVASTASPPHRSRTLGEAEADRPV
ncbi:methyltransferase domain-containing protein [Streptomyces sp. NPDC096046]|uniref:methyltransferase domain-containing protein n=1 Tax=Streptomyces sp. NPDC096046 TaxID=3155542 RepID=UPI00332C36B2